MLLMHDTMQMTAGGKMKKNIQSNDAYVGNEAGQSPHSAPPLAPTTKKTAQDHEKLKKSATSHHKKDCAVKAAKTPHFPLGWQTKEQDTGEGRGLSGEESGELWLEK